MILVWGTFKVLRELTDMTSRQLENSIQELKSELGTLIGESTEALGVMTIPRKIYKEDQH